MKAYRWCVTIHISVELRYLFNKVVILVVTELCPFRCMPHRNLDPDIGSIYIFRQFSHFLQIHAVITPQIRPQAFLTHKLKLRIR